MLDIIRSNAQSFGVKLAFGLIILVFIFWGVGSLGDNDRANIVAKVNGEPILGQNFERAYRNLEESILRSNPAISRQQLQGLRLGEQVLREMIQQMVLNQEAKRCGISISSKELRLTIADMKIFQNEEGKFDPDAYTRILGAQRMTPAQYEQSVSEGLLREKIYNLITAPAFSNDDEAKNRFDFLKESRTINYILYKAKDFKQKVTINDNEINEYYDKHKEEYTIPAKVNINYITIQPELLVKPENVDEQKAKDWYEANKTRFIKEDAQEKKEENSAPTYKTYDEVKNEVKLFLAQEMGAEKINDALDALIEDNILGKPMQESAQRFGLTSNESGLLTSDELIQKLGIKPEAASSLIATAEGAPIDTALDAGDKYYIVRIIKTEKAQIPALDAIKKEISEKITDEKALKLTMEHATQERLALKDGPLTNADKQNLKVQSATIERTGMNPSFIPDMNLVKAIFESKENIWLPAAYNVNEPDGAAAVILCHMETIKKPDLKEFENIHKTIQENIKQERESILFSTFMQYLLSKAKVEIINPQFINRSDS